MATRKDCVISNQQAWREGEPYFALPDSEYSLSDSILPGGEGQHQPLTTYPGVVLYAFLFLGYTVSLFVPTLKFTGPKREFGIKAAFHVFLLLMTFILERYLRVMLKRLQRQGYLQFYRHIRNLLVTPFRIVSLGTALLLLSAIFDAPNKLFHLQLVVCAELFAVGLVLFLYSRKVHHHNVQRNLPDVEHAFTSQLQVGVGDEGGEVPRLQPQWGELEDVSEKQAELNRFMAVRIIELSRELLHTQSQVKRLERDAGSSTSRQDLEAVAHLERDSRARNAQLQAELRATRTLLSSQDAESEGGGYALGDEKVALPH
ncbi:hypothetical protein CYMTET_45025 [Cymbomonas tetramitiformis]|uniref:Transmembrane protein 192 n=1 Tax=Cymbomonas tetramitiformis TaxID=36881 RepID=A0AAE0C087_9CHLO|nr:hypothetical protein CYMTET_45025 [Cymbomonas tetramitiformis]